ncbi:MAG: type II toxin-antitoxin system VapC family toxin [Nanoarchaeota archaeon]|nr:type II toxin-antitoxin system VapC family toxin [Nanoarchaeota archaeon]
MIGMDTSAVIDFFKGDASLKEVLESVDEKLVLNRIIYLETMFGIDKNKKLHQNEEEFYDELFSSLIVFELDKKSSKQSSRILNDLKKKGNTIGLFDCTIAGIFLSNGVNKILTRNTKHFENIKGLKVISY